MRGLLGLLISRLRSSSLCLRERSDYSRRSSTLNKLQIWTTAAISNVTKDMFQCVWQAWTTGGMYADIRI
jgi:hypothetical protein